MKNIFRTQNKSFTLVELLIVVGIVGILAGLIVAAINPNLLRQKARDANRKKDMSVISEALGQYYADNNRYPITSSITTLRDTYIVLTPPNGYMTAMNVSYNAVPYCYSSATGQTFTLCAQLENTSEANTPPAPFTPCAGVVTPYYCVTNPF